MSAPSRIAEMEDAFAEMKAVLGRLQLELVTAGDPAGEDEQRVRVSLPQLREGAQELRCRVSRRSGSRSTR